MNLWLTLFLVGLASIGGSLIQGTTGFGYGIFVMIFFPTLLGAMPAAVGTSSMVSFGGLAALTWRYRKHVNWKLLPLPLVIYYIVSGICIKLSTQIDTGAAKMYLGLFLVVLAFYFSFFAGKIRIKINFFTTLIATTLSGTLSGFFAIGGPPMVIYYLSATQSKEEYLGTCQCFFFLTGLYTMLVRILTGIITLDLLKYVLVGYLGFGIGLLLAGRVVDRIDAEKMKKLIYAVIGASGFWLFVSNLL